MSAAVSHGPLTWRVACLPVMRAKGRACAIDQRHHEVSTPRLAPSRSAEGWTYACRMDSVTRTVARHR